MFSFGAVHLITGRRQILNRVISQKIRGHRGHQMRNLVCASVEVRPRKQTILINCPSTSMQKHIKHLDRRKFSSFTTPTSVEVWWKASTERLLDRNQYPVGSWCTLLWHKAETLLVYWTDNKNSADLEICFRILDRLAEEQAANPHPSFTVDIYLIHAILNSWKSQFEKFHSKILPSQILRMLERFLELSPGLFSPNIATYTMLLDGASYCPDPAERIDFADTLFQRLMDESHTDPTIRPTVVTIGTVLKGLAKSGSSQGAEKAEALLRRIVNLDGEEQWQDLEVNTIHYTTVIQAYTNAGDAESAQRLLMEMLKEFVMNGNEKLRPNVRSFNTVLSAWAKSTLPHAHEKAEELFRRMGELHENGVLEDPTDTISYNCLLNSLSKRARNIPNALERAEVIVNDLLQRWSSEKANASQQPTVVTFTSLFRILAVSNLPDKKEKAHFWLQRAKEVGVDDDRFLLDQYQTTLSRREGRPRISEVNLQQHRYYK